MQPRILAALAACVALTPIGAQRKVLVVDDGPDVGDFTEIHAAVAAANDGDLVLVRRGNYEGFAVIGKSLTITAERPGLVEVRATSGSPERSVEVANLAAHQSVTIRGLQTRVSNTGSVGESVYVHDNTGARAGSVVFEQTTDSGRCRRASTRRTRTPCRCSRSSIGTMARAAAGPRSTWVRSNAEPGASLPNA